MYKTIVIVSLFCVAPIAHSKPLMILSDTLDENESYIGLNVAAGKKATRNHYDISGGITGNGKAQNEQLKTEISYQLGTSNKSAISLTLPYVLLDNSKTEETFSTNDRFDAKDKASGVGDLETIFGYSIVNDGTNRISILGLVKLPIGSDKNGKAEVVKNGVKTQDLQKGGAGSGTIDYGLAMSWSRIYNEREPFVDIAYTVNGSKTEDGEKINIGNDYLIRIGMRSILTPEISYFLSAAYAGITRSEYGATTVDAYTAQIIEGHILIDIKRNRWIEIQGGYMETDNINVTNSLVGITAKSSSTLLKLQIGFKKEL